MPYALSRIDQENLLTLAAKATNTEGWKPDAVAFSVSAPGEDQPIIGIGVFEDFTVSRDATFSFSMMQPARGGVTRGVIESFIKLAFHDRALRLDRVWITTTDDNIPALVALVKLGATFEHRKRAAFRRKEAGIETVKDAIVFSMVNPKFTAPAARAQDNGD